MNDQEVEETEGYNSIGDAIKAHAGIITFLTILVFMKIGILPSHIILVVIGALAGVFGVFELMGSKCRVLAAIGWIIAALWMIFGNTGILSGY